MILTARLRLEPAGPDRADDLWRLHQDEEIAYWYGGPWTREHATEIGRAGLRHAFGALGAAEVVAFTERHHRRSRAVMERLGMRYVREIRRAGLVEGRDGVHPDAPFALYVASPS